MTLIDADHAKATALVQLESRYILREESVGNTSHVATWHAAGAARVACDP